MVEEFRRRGKSVGILAVDASSPFSGGAILGDRIRMQQHHADPGVFIRSMATRGAMGGLAAATTEMTLLLDAAGFDVILVETVGVGQDEVDVVHLAEATVVLLVPGMGDDVQAGKAGIMEISDVFVINKADLDGAERLEREVQASLGLSHRRMAGRPPSCARWPAKGGAWPKLSTALDAVSRHTAAGAPGRPSCGGAAARSDGRKVAGSDCGSGMDGGRRRRGRAAEGSVQHRR